VPPLLLYPSTLPGLAPALAWPAVVLVVAHIFFLVLRHGFDRDYVLGLSPLFDMWWENNLPAYFAAQLWVIASTLLFLISRGDPDRRGRWVLLAAVALFLAMDEALQFHEKLILPMRSLIGGTGVLFFPWFLPYVAAMAVLAVAYLPFLRQLPRPTTVGILVAGAVFCSGALGMEMVEGIFFEDDPFARTLLLDVLVTIEESLELAGILLFIHALARHIHTWGGFSLRLGGPG
jgi:hypothetical protein